MEHSRSQDPSNRSSWTAIIATERKAVVAKNITDFLAAADCGALNQGEQKVEIGRHYGMGEGT